MNVINPLFLIEQTNCIDFLKYIFMLKPKQLFIIIYVNVSMKRVYRYKTHSSLNHTHRSLTVIWRSRGFDVLVKIQIFRMANWNVFDPLY
jgi:hypothetical protein